MWLTTNTTIVLMPFASKSTRDTPKYFC